MVAICDTNANMDVKILKCEISSHTLTNITHYITNMVRNEKLHDQMCKHENLHCPKKGMLHTKQKYKIAAVSFNQKKLIPP